MKRAGNAVGKVRKGSDVMAHGVGKPGFGSKVPKGGGSGSWAKPGGAQSISGHIK